MKSNINLSLWKSNPNLGITQDVKIVTTANMTDLQY